MDRKRPGGLLLVAMVGIILGVLGVCGGCFGAAGQLFQDSINDTSRAMLEAQPGQTQDMLDRQQRMQERLEAMTDPLKPALIGYQVLNLIASLALLVGAIFLLKWRPDAPKIFFAAVVASLVIEIPGSLLAVWIQLQTKAIMADYATGLNDPALGPGGERAMGAMVDASTTVGFIIAILWVVVKLGYYAYSAIYVRKPAVRALFASQ
jgi:hypothetical protein